MQAENSKCQVENNAFSRRPMAADIGYCLAMIMEI